MWNPSNLFAKYEQYFGISSTQSGLIFGIVVALGISIGIYMGAKDVGIGGERVVAGKPLVYRPYSVSLLFLAMSATIGLIIALMITFIM